VKKYALVPKEISNTGIRVWIGAFCETADEGRPPDGELRVAGMVLPVTWPPFDDAALESVRGRIFKQEIDVPIAARRAEAALFIDGNLQASATLGTLRSLPAAGEKPLTILLGSCYGSGRDRHQGAASVFAEMCARGQDPDLKFLCGDQVYLDTPAFYSWFRHAPGALAEKFLGTYLRSWSDQGLLPLLRHGATYLSMDDHEIWNEYPNGRGRSGRTVDWERSALAFFRFFQGSGGSREIRIPPVSFFVLDTRSNRTESKERFVSADQLLALGRWVKALTGPGVLVLTEPVFGETRTFGSSISRLIGAADSLRDYAQYRELAELLSGSEHTIVVLCGDVHWGRIAECTLATGARLIEVVSSPLCLVDIGISRWFRPWTPAPTPFQGGIGPWPKVETVPYRVTQNHFVSLELSRADGGRVGMAVRLWRVGANPGGEIVYSTIL